MLPKKDDRALDEICEIRILKQKKPKTLWISNKIL
jgi:hypothetical protein